MRYSLIHSLCLATAALLPTSKVLASEIAFQNYEVDTPPYDYGNLVGDGFDSENLTPAQEFSPMVSGALDSISMFVFRYPAKNTPPLQVAIRTVGTDGLPAATLGKVATTLILPQPPNNVYPTFTTVDFSTANVELTAGQNYFVVFGVATPTDLPYDYYVSDVPKNSKSFGVSSIVSRTGEIGPAWEPTPTYIELEIAMSITVVPEPATASLMLTAAVLVASCYSRKSRVCR